MTGILPVLRGLVKTPEPSKVLPSLCGESLELSYAPLIKKNYSNADTGKNLYRLVYCSVL